MKFVKLFENYFSDKRNFDDKYKNIKTKLFLSLKEKK